MNTERACLLLRTCDATALDPYNASFQWQNVDIRSVLGTLYDKYDYFSLSLVGVQTGVLNTSLLGGHDEFHKIYMTGLAWESCTYNFSQKCNTNMACVGTLSMDGVSTDSGITSGVTTTSGVTYESSKTIENCFRKGNPITNISLYLYQILTDKLNVPNHAGNGTVYPQCAYLFTIRPIKEYKDISAVLFLTNIQATTTAVGTATYQNLDLKTCLGQLWYEYDYFNLVPVECQITSMTATVNGDPNNTSVYIQLTGLPFVNSTYDSLLACNTEYAYCGYLNFSNAINSGTAGAQTFFPDTSPIMFSKKYDIVNFTINWYNPYERIKYSGSNSTAYEMVFKIHGVKKMKH